MSGAGQEGIKTDIISIEFAEKVIGIMKNSGLDEITLEDGAETLYIKADGKGAVQPNKIPSAPKINTAHSIDDKYKSKKLTPVISGMIGILFLRPRPDVAPFVKTGDKVKKGQQLCIIETIKLMNAVTSEFSGTVKEICIEEGRPVEYGQTIMYIEQD